MPEPRAPLPQPGGASFLTDGGLETCLAFHDGLDLPAFAAFPLLADEDGRRRLPVVLSFTVETDGRLPSGQALRAAVEQVDQATGASDYPHFWTGAAEPRCR